MSSPRFGKTRHAIPRGALVTCVEVRDCVRWAEYMWTDGKNIGGLGALPVELLLKMHDSKALIVADPWYLTGRS